MKTLIWTLLALAALTPAVMYLIQRVRSKKADKEGVVVYATVISVEAMKMFRKPTGIVKIGLWIQEPGKERREIELRTRTAPGQNIKPGVMLAVVVDPKDPKRVYPASAESMKRVQLTGSRDQRRQMKKKGL